MADADFLSEAALALVRAEEIRGEDGRVVRERSIADLTQAIALCSDLEADAAGTRQRGVVMIPKRRPL